MNEKTRTKLTCELLSYSIANKETRTPMRDCFVKKYGTNITDAALITVWDDMVKVARMSGVSNVERRGNQWTENGIVIRENTTIINV